MISSKDNFEDMRQQEMAPEYKSENQTVASGLTIGGNNLLNMDMATIETIARSIVQEVRDGNKDAMDVLIYAKKGAAFFKAIDDNVKDVAYGKSYAVKSVPYAAHGCKVEAAELGVKYDYKTAGDSEWEFLNSKFEAAKKAKEDREKFLKTIKGKLDVIVEGEPITIQEPIKSGTMGYKITIG